MRPFVGLVLFRFDVGTRRVAKCRVVAIPFCPFGVLVGDLVGHFLWRRGLFRLDDDAHFVSHHYGGTKATRSGAATILCLVARHALLLFLFGPVSMGRQIVGFGNAPRPDCGCFIIIIITTTAIVVARVNCRSAHGGSGVLVFLASHDRVSTCSEEEISCLVVVVGEKEKEISCSVSFVALPVSRRSCT